MEKIWMSKSLFHVMIFKTPRSRSSKLLSGQREDAALTASRSRSRLSNASQPAVSLIAKKEIGGTHAIPVTRAMTEAEEMSVIHVMVTRTEMTIEPRTTPALLAIGKPRGPPLHIVTRGITEVSTLLAEITKTRGTTESVIIMPEKRSRPGTTESRGAAISAMTTDESREATTRGTLATTTATTRTIRLETLVLIKTTAKRQVGETA